MATKTWKLQKEKRYGTQHAAVPYVVIDSPGYRRASHTARSLLIDIARQYRGNNNGKLTACMKYLEPMGWKSHDVIVRARRELLECRLLLETRKGGFPNKAAWYALTWYSLDVTEGLDINPARYRTGQYLEPDPPTLPKKRRPASEKSGAGLTPSDGAAPTATAPCDGIGTLPPAPSGGAMWARNTPFAAPSGGSYLEEPSAVGVGL